MMPKSTATRVPSSATNRLPWCMSAWKKPSRSAWLRKTSITNAAMSEGSCPAARKPATSSIGTPRTRSTVNTRREVRVQSTFGTR